MTQSTPLTPVETADPYQSIRLALRHGKALRIGASLVLAATIGWLGVRTGLPELWAIGAGAGIALNYVGKVALEVLALVADTLVPQ